MREGGIEMRQVETIFDFIPLRVSFVIENIEELVELWLRLSISPADLNERYRHRDLLSSANLQPLREALGALIKQRGLHKTSEEGR